MNIRRAFGIGPAAGAALILLFALLPAKAAHAAGQAVTICVDPEPPPWTYWELDARGHRTGALRGFSVDIIRASFAALGKEAKFVGDLPWARCVRSVQIGEVDFAMDAYYDEERAKTLDYSTHYSTMTPTAFYMPSLPARPKTLADLGKLHGCGLKALSYRNYGLDDSKLDLGADDTDMLVKKMKAGRCDFFLDDIEIVQGYSIDGPAPFAVGDLLHSPIEDARASSSHVMALRGSANAKLIPALNAAIAEEISSGRAAKYWAAHGGKPPYKP